MEAPAQKKYREDCEAMGNIWSGTAPTIKNTQVYTDFIHMQTKVLWFLLLLPLFGNRILL